MSRFRRSRLPQALVLALCLGAASTPAAALTYVVDTFIDLPDDDLADGRCSWNSSLSANVPTCTLRAAVMQANAMPIEPNAPVAAIQLKPGETYYLSGASDDSDLVGSAGDLDIRRPMAIGVASIFERAAIHANEDTERVFHFAEKAGGSRVFGAVLSTSRTGGPWNLLYAEQGAGALTIENVRVPDSRNTGLALMRFNNPSTTIRDTEFQFSSRSIWAQSNVLTLERTTMAGDLDGAAIIAIDSAVTVRLSTFSNNRLHIATTDSNLFVLESTFVGSTHNALDMQATGGGMLHIRNSLFSNASGASCSFDDGSPIVNVAGSVFDDASCASGAAPEAPNLFDATVLLSPLALHGGTTRTHELLPQSDGIDWVAPASCTSDSTDQRGYPRAVDYSGLQPAHCDAGATELQLQPPPPEGHIFGDGFEGD